MNPNIHDFKPYVVTFSTPVMEASSPSSMKALQTQVPHNKEYLDLYSKEYASHHIYHHS
jgi:hypothetical protein